MSHSTAVACALLSALALLPAAQAHDAAPAAAAVVGDLGETTFPSSGAAAAQPDFMRGLLLLHSFEFDTARASFRAAIEKDPGFVMAFWGEALSHNMPIWGEQDLLAARAVLARLAPTREERLARAPTERERLYLATVEALYGDGDKVDRDAAYNKALGELSRKYPDDLDARAFYALSWLGLTGTVRDTANYMRGAAEAEAVYEVNKRHPGALHYLVHAYDDPVHAPLGLRAARLYGKVAPAASHAQHMPSHIFFALGMWEDAIEANVASLATARSQGQDGYHPLEWLAYAYLQQGPQAEAAKLVAIVEQDLAKGPTQRNRSSLAYLRAMWIAETGGAADVNAWPDVSEAGIASIYPFTAQDFMRGIAAARQGRFAEATRYVVRLRERTERARDHVAGVVANGYDTVTPEEIEQGGLLALALEGAILCAQGEQDAGIAKVREAIAISGTLAFEYGPPFSAKPLAELLGDLLLAAGRPAEAAAAYQESLAVHPDRKLSIEGLTAARAAAWSCRHCAEAAGVTATVITPE
jgi:tetratricopeptide (TPR) repeat protein